MDKLPFLQDIIIPYIMSVMKGTSCFEQQNRIVLVVFKIKDVKNDTISATPLLHFLF